MKYVIEIEDQDGNTCRIALDLPIAKIRAKPDNSTWRALNKGFLKFHSGGCGCYGIVGSGLIGNEKFGLFEESYLNLFVGKTSVATLNGFADNLGLVNSSGDGAVKQEAVIGFKPGKFSWTLVE